MTEQSRIYRFKLLLFLAASFLITGAAANAQVAFISDPDQFLALHPQIAVVQIFDIGNVPPGGSVSCDPPVDVNSNDACFTPGDIFPGLVFGSSALSLIGENFQGTSGNEENALITGFVDGTFDIFFSDLPIPVFVVAIGPGCVTEGGACVGTVTIRVFGEGGVQLGSTQIEVDSTFDDFLGIDSIQRITRVNISGPSDTFEGMVGVIIAADNNTANVPTLTEWGMITAAAGFVLIGAFYAVRRRKAAV